MTARLLVYSILAFAVATRCLRPTLIAVKPSISTIDNPASGVLKQSENGHPGYLTAAGLSGQYCDQRTDKHRCNDNRLLVCLPKDSGATLLQSSALTANNGDRKAVISGGVQAPINMDPGNLRLLDALASAGGLSPDADRVILVRHDYGTLERIRMRALLGRHHAKFNIPIEPGMLIVVPEVGKVHVIGDVQQPGGFMILHDDDTTVLELIALSGGLGTQNHERAFIYRNVPASPDETAFSIPLQEIMEGKSTDPKLLAGDILYIPNNPNLELNPLPEGCVATWGSRIYR